MKYIIYELVSSKEPRIEYRNYSTEVIYSEVLEKLDLTLIEEEHLTMESAIKTIEENKERLKLKKLTILPIYEINWEGNIK